MFKNRFLSPWFALALIGISVLVVYSNIYNNPFVFDDVLNIVEKETIRGLSNYLSLDKLLKPRAIVDFTFALNYRFGKLNVFGYHLVNILIHIINGFLVYFLVSIILKQGLKFSNSSVPSISESPDFAIKTIPLFAALIFVIHPIQTQAVTFTVQRYASMAAIFYMASVLFYFKARIIQQRDQSRERIEQEKDEKINKLQLSSFYVLAILCGVLAFLSKQNTASLPLAILFVEFLLIDRTWQQWKKKLPLFALFFALWILFILYIVGLFGGGLEGGGLLEDVSGLMKEAETVGRWQYLCTQFNVVVIYLRLMFFPVLQNLDYLYPFKNGFFDAYTPFAFLFLIGLAALGAWHIKKQPVISLAIFWFFITLSVESSIIPIRDALFEHRLYLPMLGFGVFVSYQLFRYLSKSRFLVLVLCIAIMVSLGAATYKRNAVWNDKITLWSDVVSKSPYNYGAHNNLGLALVAQHRIKEAIDHYMQALRIKPAFGEAHNNLGTALYKLGRTKEAIDQFLQALQINPESAEGHYNLGLVLDRENRTEEAIEHYLQALRIKPDEDAHYNLGNALDKLGRTEEAIEHYLLALKIKPEYVEVHNNLGNSLLKQNKAVEAIRHFNEALRLNPKFVAVYNSLSVALIRMGKPDEAIDHLQKALHINSEDPATLVNLGGAFIGIGRFDEAVVHCRKALEIKPDFPKAHMNLGIALANTGKIADAITHLRKALQIDPNNVETQHNLNNILATLEQIDREISNIQTELMLAPKDPVLNYKLGSMYKMKGQLDKAQDYFTKALSLRPEFPEALYELAKLYIGQGEYEKALSLYHKMITFLPDNPAGYYNMACIYARQNRPEESVAWLNKAVAKGFDDWNHIKTDSDLANIRSSSQYKAFIKGR
ncbi:tetratricopeptide repeat protein [Thermodesulfobacteriota bacterium]